MIVFYFILPVALLVPCMHMFNMDTLDVNAITIGKHFLASLIKTY